MWVCLKLLPFFLGKVYQSCFSKKIATNLRYTRYTYVYPIFRHLLKVRPRYTLGSLESLASQEKLVDWRFVLPVGAPSCSSCTFDDDIWWYVLILFTHIQTYIHTHVHTHIYIVNVTCGIPPKYIYMSMYMYMSVSIWEPPILGIPL